MKVKVIEKFRDKKTGDIRNVGEVFTASKERFAEILKVGRFVEAFVDEPTPKKKKEAK